LSLAILKSRAQLGSDAPPVTIEVFLSGGLPSFSIVGMPETAVRESKDRVRGAILSSGFKFPQERITVSLAPADMRKTGGRFDLAIALGILGAGKQLPVDAMHGIEFYGELALNGDIRAVPGVLPIQDGDIPVAIDKLEKALIRTDGCVLRGSPDGNGPERDWITDCTAQMETYAVLSAALDALTP